MKKTNVLAAMKSFRSMMDKRYFSFSVDESVSGGAVLWFQGELGEPDRVSLSKMAISSSAPSGNEKALWLQSSELSGLTDPDIVVDINNDTSMDNPTMVFTDEDGKAYRI